MEVRDVTRKAIKIGACSESGKATDWKSLCWLFFSPQGREFCEENNYPSLDLFRGMAKNIDSYGIYVDRGCFQWLKVTKMKANHNRLMLIFHLI